MIDRDAYEKAVIEGMLKLDAVLFPPQVMEAFRVASEVDIAEGKNLCLPCGASTMHRVYGPGHPAHRAWLCKACGDAMWKRGRLHGTVHFDMTKP